MQRDELAAWLRLTLTPGVGNGAARRLLAAFGLPQNIFAQGERAWQSCVTTAQARALARVPEEPLAPSYQCVLDALGFDPLGLDALVARTGLDAATLQVRLLELELEGRVARLPGGLFQRTGQA